MASDFEKPGKSTYPLPEEIPEKCGLFQCGIFFFLEKHLRKKLVEAGLKTIGDMARARIHDPGSAGRKGKDTSSISIPEESMTPYSGGSGGRSKGFSVEKTFNEDIVSLKQVLPILLEQCDVVSTRMRRKGRNVPCVSVIFRTLDFKNRSHQTKLKNATDVTDEIYENARKLLQNSGRDSPFALLEWH